MKRRATLAALLALGAGTMAGRASAQPPKRIGVIAFRGSLMNRGNTDGIAFVTAMKELGYQEDREYVLDDRPRQQQEQIPDMVRDLVRLKTDVIIAASPPSILAAKSVTDRVPIVMMYSAEPVAMGLVRSLNRPGGNLTGLTWDHGFETNLKALELLKEALPSLRRVALLWDATDSVHPVYAKYYEKAAPQVGLALISAPVRQTSDFELTFAQMRKERAEALVILPSAQITVPHRNEIMALAARDRIPTLVANVGRDFPDALLYHGPNLTAMPRRVAAYVDRILKGAKPADLPIEQPDKYDVIVDLRAARKFGLTIPTSVLLRADRVIRDKYGN